ncbi:HupE/UreJ family protein [Porticoccaceae bacterium LTM1]|nr:HupE/UreJ family protein [Porticoccaceae bacterium LTM1]
MSRFFPVFLWVAVLATCLASKSVLAHDVDPEVLLSEHYKTMVDYRGGINFGFGMPATMAPDDGGADLKYERIELSLGEIIRFYVKEGFKHIIPSGLDHVLFVLGLFFLNRRLRPLLWQVSAFTVAHTITLGLASAGYIPLNHDWVEALIALSICYVAVENLITDKLHSWRPVVVFGFGLLHGIGFASVLGEIGLPNNEFFPALISFNIGVELGQLAVILLAFLAFIWLFNKSWYRTAIMTPVCSIIALIGGWWFIERAFL